MLRYLNRWILYPLAEHWQGRDIRRKVTLLRREMSLPFEERRRHRLVRLARMLQRSRRDVPYYRDLFAAKRIDVARVAQDARFMEELPCLTKDIIREQGVRLLSERFDIRRLHARKTGGSTGPAAVIFYDQQALDWTAAVNVLVREWAGKTLGMKESHLSSRFPEVFHWKDRLKEYCKCLALHRGNIYTDTFDAAGLDQMWRSLRRAQPYLLQGHPSTVYALAAHLRDRQIAARGAIRVFESTGEVLDDKKRVLIESVFGCRVLDRFGNAEFGVVAYELADDPSRLQVLDVATWPETLPHESGVDELVLTGLLNEAMPLIRYRTGDLAELQTAADGFYLTKLVGRVHDMVRIGEQHFPTHYVQDLLGRLEGIDEFQVEQLTGGSIRLRLVVPEAIRRAEITRRVAAWWRDRVEFEFIEFSQLQRGGWRNKFRFKIDSPWDDETGCAIERDPPARLAS